MITTMTKQTSLPFSYFIYGFSVFLFSYLAAVPEVSAESSESLTGLEIMQKNIEAESAHDEMSNLRIILTNSRGKTQQRSLVWKTVTLEDGTKKSIVYFSRPKSIRGTALLTIEHAEGDDERWLYLPALQKTRRISASEKADNFMGTDFSYEDLVTEEIDSHNYVRGDTSQCNKPCLVVIATPGNERQKTESGYSKRVITLNPENFMVTSVDYYDKSGHLSKSYQADDFRIVDSNGSVRPFKTEMVDHINSRKTQMLFDSFVINTGINEDEISLRALTRGL